VEEFLAEAGHEVIAIARLAEAPIDMTAKCLPNLIVLRDGAVKKCVPSALE
jgi:hypothetical protein